MFLCCKAENSTTTGGLIEPRYMDRFYLWKLHITKVDGLEGPGTILFKATYSGRSMFSDSIKVSQKMEPQSRYVFKDVPGCDDVSVELFRGTPCADSRIATLGIDLGPYRQPNETSDLHIAIPGTTASLTLIVSCAVLADDDDEQASCMDVPDTSDSSCAVS